MKIREKLVERKTIEELGRQARKAARYKQKIWTVEEIEFLNRKVKLLKEELNWK